VPPQRRRPDLEETREALRRHDERVEEDQETAEDPAPEPDEDDEQEPAE
jgi:hypothetical protein